MKQKLSSSSQSDRPSVRGVSHAAAPQSIKQICDRLGFPNPSFFGKYVKDHFGMTPLEFRRT